jgi:hypothetical protein
VIEEALLEAVVKCGAAGGRAIGCHRNGMDQAGLGLAIAGDGAQPGFGWLLPIRWAGGDGDGY